MGAHRTSDFDEHDGVAHDAATYRFTFQNSAKLVVLLGFLDERAPVAVFSIVGSEPLGDHFASLARLETDGRNRRTRSSTRERSRPAGN